MSLEIDSQPSVQISNSAFCLGIGTVVVPVVRPLTVRERLLDKVPEERLPDVMCILKKVPPVDLWFALSMQTLVLDGPTGVQRYGLIRDYLTLLLGTFSMGGVALFFASHALTPYAQRNLDVTLTFIFVPLLVLLGLYLCTHHAQMLGKRIFECHQSSRSEALE